MAILITGGAGYIGSHMVLQLREAGEALLVVDDLSTGFRNAVPADVKLIVGDFGDAALMREVFKNNDIEAIIHFAAKIIVPESLTDPLGYYLNNVAKARTLLECAVEAGVKHFIFSSTAAVYGDPAHNPVEETEPLKPVSPYGRSKLMVEWMLEDVARAYPITYTILRYFNVAGADPLGRSGQSTANATHIIKIAVQAALGLRRGVEVFGVDYPTPDGTCLRDYIQVSDLARAHQDALERLRAGGGNLTCNCGYQKSFSVFDVINVVKEVSGVDFPVKIGARRLGDPAAIISSTKLIRAELNWRPQYDALEKMIAQALAWERKLLELKSQGLGFE